MSRKINDCFANNGELMLTQKALQLLSQSAQPSVGIETVQLPQAAGRFLAETVRSERDVPGFDNSAVDGFGFCRSELKAGTAAELPVSDVIAAGKSKNLPWQKNTAVRILTGAKVPHGVDTVVMQEDVQQIAATQEQPQRVIIPNVIKLGANLRKRGENIKSGTNILSQGQRLRPQDIGQAAAIGLAKLPVYQRLKVALFSTGDEIYNPGETLSSDGVYDINRFTLQALLTEMGCEVTDLGILPDDLCAIQHKLLIAARQHQAILSSGGVSVGDEDHVLTAINTLGQVHFWRLAIKPGRPLLFGQIESSTFIGFPGNPVATMLCFLLFARPVLQRLAGSSWREPRYFQVRLQIKINKRLGRREWLRASLKQDGQGQNWAQPFPQEGSGILTSMVATEGFIELEEDATLLEAGALVNFLPYSELGLLR